MDSFNASTSCALLKCVSQGLPSMGSEDWTGIAKGTASEIHCAGRDYLALERRHPSMSTNIIQRNGMKRSEQAAK
ncbi:hypothetical protein TNCV_249421 [Trichonephila clavipes]|nr:hypothetical protein TNCV_249421 [Trichonephila clavipes]